MNNLSNSVRLTGRLGAAPEMRELENEKKVAKISLATHYYRKNGKGETVEEIVGFAEAIRAVAEPLPLHDVSTVSVSGIGPSPLLDTCGTGGDATGTFNISTAAAFVVAGAGVRVAKHGNRSLSSKCGSADVMEALGIKISLPSAVLAACLEEVGIVFLFAPAMHSAMKYVQPARRELRLRTIFNLLGPLTNPARASAQVVGVYSLNLVEKVAEALSMLGTHRALVVHGSDGIDELTTTGESVVARVEETEPGKEPTIKAARMTPEMAGLPRAKLEDFTGGDIPTNKALLYDVITGIKGARRDIVLLNAAATLVAAGLTDDLKQGVAMGAEAIDSGQAAATLAKLRAFGEMHARK